MAKNTPAAKVEPTPESPAVTPPVETPTTPPTEAGTVTRKVNEIMIGLGYETAPEEVKPAKQPEAKPEVKTKVAEPVPEPDAKAEKQPAAKDAEKPKEDEEPAAPKAKRKATKPPELDQEQFAERVAEKISAKTAAKPEPVKEPEPAPALADPDKRKREILEVMAEDKRYASLPAEFDAFVAQRDRYIKKWTADHPGETFDPEDEAHNEFYEQHDPASREGFDPTDYSSAAGKLEARREFDRRWQEKEVTASREKAYNEVLQRSSEQVNAQTAALREHTTAKLAELIGEPAEEAAKLLDEDGPLQRMQAASERDLGILIAETNKLLSPELGYKKDDGNVAHQFIERSLQGFENDMAELDTKGMGTLLNNALGSKHHLAGKTFVPIQEYLRLSEAQRQRAWTLYTEPKIVSALLTATAQNTLASDIEALFKVADRKKSHSAQKSSAQETTQSDAAKVEIPAVAEHKEPSPSISSSADRVTPIDTPKTAFSKFGELVADALSK